MISSVWFKQKKKQKKKKLTETKLINEYFNRKDCLLFPGNVILTQNLFKKLPKSLGRFYQNFVYFQ